MPGRFRSRTRFLSRFPVSVASPFAETQAPAGRTRARKRTHKIRGEAHTLVKVSTLRTRTAASGTKTSSRGKVLRVRSGAKPEAAQHRHELPLSAVCGHSLSRYRLTAVDPFATFETALPTEPLAASGRRGSSGLVNSLFDDFAGGGEELRRERDPDLPGSLEV
jgi:hypothetical protein